MRGWRDLDYVHFSSPLFASAFTAIGIIRRGDNVRDDIVTIANRLVNDIVTKIFFARS